MSNEPQQLLGPASLEFLEGCEAGRRSVWRDRIPARLTLEQLAFMEWVRRPPWWRPFARRKFDRQPKGYLAIHLRPEDVEKLPMVVRYRRPGLLARLIRSAERNLKFCSEGAQAPEKQGDGE